MVEPLNMPKELEPYGWYVGSKERPDYYLRQDLSVRELVNVSKENGGYFASETEALLARDEYYERYRQESKIMSKQVNIEDVIGEALNNAKEAAQVTGGCCCGPDIDQENKFLGQVYSSDGSFVETLHSADKKDFKNYLKDPENWGRRVLVYKGVSAYASDVPVTEHILPGKKKKSKSKTK